jgi:thiamine kinase-like enzyme
MPLDNVDACLPPALQGPDTTIVRIRAGLSGAGVYRVQAAGQVFVLKASPSAPLADFERTLRQLRLAADAGLAPSIVHVDAERRAILSAFVVERSFPSFYFSPQTRPAALELLGRTLRRLHDLPAPEQPSKTPEEFLGEVWSRLSTAGPLPGFVHEAISRVRDEPAPARERALVLSHNDVNPTNLAFDGERLFLLDWDTSGQNDPFYDLATISVFLRMEADECRALLAAHDGASVSVLPERFRYNQRLAAVLCGAMFLQLARSAGHAGANGETLASSPSLSDFYQRARSGAVAFASPAGQWEFGLALIKTSAEL